MTMKAVAIRRYGGLDALEYGDYPRPRPAGRQLLVRVHAASVNPRDWLLREGRYVFRFAVRMPVILGSDFSGVVAECGPDARLFREGDAVFGMQTAFGNMGACADYVAVDERSVAAKPAAVSHGEAAAVPCAGLTAWQAFTRESRVGPGHRVTVIGASGGVGSYAVQLAKVLGARVTGVTSGPNEALVRGLGADATIDYREAHFAAGVRDQDVVFDTIGRESLASCAPAMTDNGTYITTIPSPATAGQGLAAAARRLVHGGRGRRARIVLCRADGRDLARLAELLDDGRLVSVIDSVYPLADTAAAHARSRTFRARGKIVLEVVPGAVGTTTAREATSCSVSSTAGG
jgi:NADPH:quinone reductase-like Zn-dependent oxidoreductase